MAARRGTSGTYRRLHLILHWMGGRQAGNGGGRGGAGGTDRRRDLVLRCIGWGDSRLATEKVEGAPEAPTAAEIWSCGVAA